MKTEGVKVSEVHESRESPRLWVAGLIAVLLVITTVGGFFYVRSVRLLQPASNQHTIGSLSMTAQLSFKCTLPVQSYANRALVSLPDGGVSIEGTLDRSTGKGSQGSTYSGGKWLPVQAGWVSPDGKSYGYTTETTGVPGQAPTATVNVHDIARGTNRTVWSGDGSASMLGWGPAGIYFVLQPSGMYGTPQPAGQGAALGVWVVDPSNSSGAHRVGPNPAVTPVPGEPGPPLFQFGSVIGGGSAWYVQPTFAKQPTTGLGPGIAYIPQASTLLRMDLKDGSVSTWFTSPDSSNARIAGLDSQNHPILIVSQIPKITKPVQDGRPMITTEQMYPPAPELLILTSPDQSTRIGNGSSSEFRPSSVVADGHGIWISSPGTLWLYRQGSLTKVADVPQQLFPLPTPPANLPTKPPMPDLPSPPPGYPTGVTLGLLGRCS
jgi:hypothetical protein